ncbi:MAG: hypothetical protein OEV40_14780 [Acidimicrobiia bacterium]|nr:hypothetical protein [Acidimicrobiia bacterium]
MSLADDDALLRVLTEPVDGVTPDLADWIGRRLANHDKPATI